MSKQRISSVVETKYGRLFLHANGIVYFYMHDNLTIDVPDAQQMVRDAQSLDQSPQIRLLIVSGSNNDLSFNAQRFFASVPGFAHLAFVTRTRLQAEVGKFLVTMMRALKSNYEFKVFYEVSQAEAWLLSFS